MNGKEQRFQTFVTRVRPHRVAILINSHDPHWHTSCLAVIEYLSKLWGGSHCVIIPTDGKQISEEFWAVLSAYDPDIFYQYQTTYADLRRRDPEKFGKFVTDEMAKHRAADFSSEEARTQLEEAVANSPDSTFTISEDLKREILIRLAPFHFEKQPTSHMAERQLPIGRINLGSTPGYPLTRVFDVLKSTKKPKNILQLIHDVAPDAGPPELWLTAAIGTGDYKYFSELNSLDIPTLPVPTETLETLPPICW